jgi:acetyltransferase-like isoleucine patch superfamily enzyme
MAWLTDKQLSLIPFKSIGPNVRISDKASIHNPEMIDIGMNSRIDDYCVVSGAVSIGRNVHIAVFCNIAGGEKGVSLDDFSGLAYGCHVFSQSDDYSGQTMTNPTVPKKYKNESKKSVYIGRHCIVGACSVVFPGVDMREGSALGAMSMLTKSTQAWKIYFGTPAKIIKNRDKGLLTLEKMYIEETIKDSG